LQRCLFYNTKIVFQIIPNFYPLLADKVRAGIFSSLRQILEKRVLPTLFPLFEHPKLDRELRTMVREAFKEFCLPPTAEGNNLSGFEF
jgi:integrator complex subunit 3